MEMVNGCPAIDDLSAKMAETKLEENVPNGIENINLASPQHQPMRLPFTSPPTEVLGAKFPDMATLMTQTAASPNLFQVTTDVAQQIVQYLVQTQHANSMAQPAPNFLQAPFNHFLMGGDQNRMLRPSVNLCAPAQSSAGSSSTQEVYWQYNPGPEIYSRKVFVGGLPIDIDEEEINATFSRFGPLVVDWPRRTESHYPPRGYVFLVFENEPSVQALIEQCHKEDDKHYLFISSPTMKDKPVQVRPWRLADADFVVDATMPLDPRKTVFIGGVPRPLKAVELAHLMDRLYGGVCYAGIDTDPELKYPKGAARVSFSNQQSFIAAIAGRFVQIQHTEADKRVEVKPYVMDDQMCDECQGSRCGGKYAPFFCPNVACLQYYCEHCWHAMHNQRGRHNHKPMAKLGEQGAKVMDHFNRRQAALTVKQTQQPTAPPPQTLAPSLTAPPAPPCWWPGY